jgi:hypothetical protein
MSRKTLVMVESTPLDGIGCGGVYSDGERMKWDAWRERMRRLRICTMVGSNRKRRGIGGRLIEREDRDRKTNVWSAIDELGFFKAMVSQLTCEGPEWVVVSGRLE